MILLMRKEGQINSDELWWNMNLRYTLFLQQSTEIYDLLATMSSADATKTGSFPQRKLG